MVKGGGQWTARATLTLAKDNYVCFALNLCSGTAPAVK